MQSILEPAVQTTRAERQAALCFLANRTALWQAQPALAERLIPPPADYEWVLARDGSLTALLPSGRWWAGCSVPLLAGRELLKKLEASPLHSCLLAPAHAGLLRAARERTGDAAALITIVPDEMTLSMLLACHDFSAEIARHRLWFAAGIGWSDDLRSLLTDTPGLSTPARFIKCKLVEESTAAALVATAQGVFSEVLADRTRRLQQLREQPPTPTRPLLVIAGTQFRLWEDAGDVLADQVAGLDVGRLDVDDPATSSPLALALAAADARALVSANLSRADAANLVELSTPWITWVTRASVPPYSPAAPNDGLVLADAAWTAAALEAGWSAERLAVGAWPIQVPTGRPVAPGHLALIADTGPIETPAHVDDLSSHRLLWDAILEELHTKPLAAGVDLMQYLEDRGRRFNLPLEKLDLRAFLERLLLPACVQGVARLLLSSGFPVRLHGQGWEGLPEFQDPAQGPIASRFELQAAVSQAAAVVHPFPTKGAHPIDALGVPVIRCGGRSSSDVLAEARRLLARSTPSVRVPDSTPLLGVAVATLLRQI